MLPVGGTAVHAAEAVKCRVSLPPAPWRPAQTAAGALGVPSPGVTRRGYGSGMYPISRCSQRLALRELTAADVDAVFGIYGDPGITKYLSFEPRAREQVRQIIDRSIASAGASPRNEYALAITERKDNGLIGVGRIAVDPHQPRGATFGFALHSSVWGAGYGVEAVRLLLGLGFGDLRLHRIWGARAPLNEA